MEFDREALDNQRAKLSSQRANVRSVLKRIGSEGLNPLARLQGEGLEKVLRSTYYGYTYYGLERVLYFLCLLELQLDLVWLTVAVLTRLYLL